MTPFSIFKEPWPRIIGIPILGTALCYAFSDGNPTVLDISISVLFTGAMWQGDYLIIRGFRKKWPTLEKTGIRLVSSIGLIMLYNLVMDFTLCELLHTVGFERDPWLEHAGMNIAKNAGATFMIGTLYESGYYFRKWREQTIEMENIKSRQLRTELNALKNHISPHFLFNSLNTLIALINENPDTASQFTSKLSEVYRYTLSHKDRDVVMLRQELNFTASYYYLLKMRFEKGINLHVNVPEQAMGRYVAPLTVQMLVENAVKHNIASTHKPLHIDIYVENGRSLIVRNNLQVKHLNVHSTGFGLENAKKRYAHLSDQPVDVIETKDHFMVALPLLTIDERAAIFESNK